MIHRAITAEETEDFAESAEDGSFSEFLCEYLGDLCGLRSLLT